MEKGRKEVSKEKPEVGDVWLSFLARYLIVGGYNEYAYCIVDEAEKINVRTVPSSYFVKNCTYLGKSKVNIKELFDVE